ncbi:MAG TPA: ankyrin repeat domain-containing protein [Candidatus Dependentiae bacterium]|nr:ankyrin repeat domain-containing protein [Candidatus Dependentiae bacterium]HRQ63166.1 ankyrin repeat domain-containing protein [Candidatus Dependentiae bacterium]
MYAFKIFMMGLCVISTLSAMKRTHDTASLEQSEQHIESIELTGGDEQAEWFLGLPRDMWFEVVLRINEPLVEHDIEELKIIKLLTLQSLPESDMFQKGTLARTLKDLASLRATNSFFNKLLSAQLMGGALKEQFSYSPRDWKNTLYKLVEKSAQGTSWLRAFLQVNHDTDYYLMYWAIDAGHEQMLDVLAEHMDIEVRPNGPSDETILYSALGRIPCLQILLKHGVNVNVTNSEGKTPLHTAIIWCSGHKSIPSLLQAGADKDARDNNQWTPLHHAAFHGNVTCVQALLDAGADKDAKDNTGQTPLYKPFSVIYVTYEPLMQSYLACMHTLLQAGADKNTKDNDGNTPLHRAIMLRHRRGAEILLQAGADKNIRNNQGETPVDLVQYRYPDMADILESGNNRISKLMVGFIIGVAGGAVLCEYLF